MKEKIDPNQWVEEHGDYLFQFAMSKVNNRDLALDFVQDTLLTALQKIDQFEGRSSFRTWITTILNRKIIDYWRKEKKTHNHVELSSLNEFQSQANYAPSTPQELYEDEEKRILLNFCLDKLPDNWREIIHAKFYDEKKGDEIGKEFNITPSNFWIIIHRAKTQLRKCMEKNDQL